MAFEIINPGGDPRFLFLCDHASNALPERYGTLGLGADELERHIGWDIGAANVTRHLSQAFSAPAVLALYSRLLIDLNREPVDPTLIMQLSDGAIIPGNRTLDEAERHFRLSHFYEPYHAAISSEIDRALAGGQVPLLVSVHSFAEKWKFFERPWHIGLLWDRDERAIKPLKKILERNPDMVIGDNEPYSGELKGDCLYTHATLRGLPHVLFEIRQDLIGDATGVAKWAGVLEAALEELLTRKEIWKEELQGI
jgi:predicted N-formylglutamate amidohydrolase